MTGFGFDALVDGPGVGEGIEGTAGAELPPTAGGTTISKAAGL